MFVINNIEHDVVPLLSATPSHIVAHPISPPVSNTHTSSTSFSWSKWAQLFTCLLLATLDLTLCSFLLPAPSHIVAHTPICPAPWSHSWMSTSVHVLAAGNAKLDAQHFPLAALLSSPHQPCCPHHSHVQHIVLTIQMNMSVNVLVAGNIKLDTQCFLLAALSHIQFHYFSCIAVHLFTCSSLTCHLAPSFSCSILYVGPLHQSSHCQHLHMKSIAFSPNDCLLPCAWSHLGHPCL